MNVDADDRISNRLVSWILSQDLSPGFVVQKGYMHQLGSRVLYFRNNFHQLCGTSALLWFNESDYPTSALDERHFATTRGHHLLYERMLNRGTPLKMIPFPAVCYITDTGANLSGVSVRRWQGYRHWIKQAVSVRLVTQAIKDEFYLFS